MKVDAIISGLEKIRATGPGRWIGCCPAHPDKSPSLAIREVDDGRVLLHCFAGCPIEKILDALGIRFDALFPDGPYHQHVKAFRRPFNAADVLECVSLEAHIVALVALDVHKGIALPDAQRERLLLAVRRIEHAREMANG